MDHEKWLEQHDQMMADHEIMAARHDKEMAELRVSQTKTENTLRRAIRLAVQDARRQRERNRGFDEQMSEIRSLHAELLKALLGRGGNGQH